MQQQKKTIKRKIQEDFANEINILSEIIAGSARARTIGNRRTVELFKLLGPDMRSCEAMIEKASGHDDPRVLNQLLVRYMENPRHYSIRLNEIFLRRICRLLYHSNSEYVDLALKFLQMVVEDFGEKIYLSSAYDDNCQRCRDALIQICFNSSFVIERLSQGTHQKVFTNILKHVDKIALF